MGKKPSVAQLSWTQNGMIQFFEDFKIFPNVDYLNVYDLFKSCTRSYGGWKPSNAPGETHDSPQVARRPSHVEKAGERLHGQSAAIAR